MFPDCSNELCVYMHESDWFCSFVYWVVRALKHADPLANKNELFSLDIWHFLVRTNFVLPTNDWNFFSFKKKQNAPSHKQTLSFDRETLSWTSVRVLTFLFSPWMFEHDTPCWSWCCCPTSRNVGTFFCGNNNTAAVEEVLCCPCWCACNSRRLSEMLVPPVQNVSALQGETNIW